MVSVTDPGLWFGDRRPRGGSHANATNTVPAGAGQSEPLWLVRRACRSRTSMRPCARSSTPRHVESRRHPPVHQLRRHLARQRGVTPVMAELNRRKAVVHVHPTAANCCKNLIPEVPPGIMEYGTDTTRAILGVMFSGTATRFPDIQYIWSHAGGTAPFLAGRIERGVPQLERARAAPAQRRDARVEAVPLRHRRRRQSGRARFVAEAGHDRASVCSAPTSHPPGRVWTSSGAWRRSASARPTCVRSSGRMRSSCYRGSPRPDPVGVAAARGLWVNSTHQGWLAGTAGLPRELTNQCSAANVFTPESRHSVAYRSMSALCHIRTHVDHKSGVACAAGRQPVLWLRYRAGDQVDVGNRRHQEPANQSPERLSPLRTAAHVTIEPSRQKSLLLQDALCRLPSPHPLTRSRSDTLHRRDRLCG